ncbi:MAG: hypothetical protein AAGF12_35715 [Myxococcota bacterium]
MRASTWAIVCLSLGALFFQSAAEARPKPPVQTPGEQSCRPLSNGPAAARWGRATSTSGCFFFSGPHDLGRDDQLGRTSRFTRRGDQVTVQFGNATFVGQVRQGAVELRRVSQHTFGSIWTVTEVISARFVREQDCLVLRGTYRYTECDSAGGRCPGGCTIEAPVTIRGR